MRLELEVLIQNYRTPNTLSQHKIVHFPNAFHIIRKTTCI